MFNFSKLEMSQYRLRIGNSCGKLSGAEGFKLDWVENSYIGPIALHRREMSEFTTIGLIFNKREYKKMLKRI